MKPLRLKPLRLLAGAVAMLLIASCSPPQQPKPTVSSLVTVSHVPAAAAQPPGPNAAFDQIVAWVESAPGADAGGYRTGTDLRGEKHDLHDGTLAFTSPSRKITCYGSNDLYCSVDFQNPLPKPPTAYGNWLSGIVMFYETNLSIGQGRGDPPVFTFTGDGPELAYGQKLSFGTSDDHYACRMEQNGLTCVNKTRGSGALINDQGVVPYGCLRETKDVGNSARVYQC